MATVQMKTDYAASEVYSTASEAPPLGLFNFNYQAYKRQSNSVKIAKITAFTIIVSSFILGSFILASSYLQAKSSCDQVQALDSVLEKELMLETLQQVNKELPRAEALLGKENAEDVDLQNLEKEEMAPKSTVKQQRKILPIVEEEASDSDNSYSESDETDEMQKYPGKVPLELDLSDLAAALLQNNKRSRMNCVVERKHAEEFVDSPAKTVALPFGMNLTTDPKKARITGERISIYCDGGNDNKEQGGRGNSREEDDDNDVDDVEPIRPMFIPYQRLPIPFGRIPQQFPLTHMPQRMLPPPPMPQHMPNQMHQQPILIRQIPPPFQQLPMRPPMPPQVMQAPNAEPQSRNMLESHPQQQTVRIHVQQIPFREIHVADDVPVQIPTQHQELPQFQIQRMPLSVALQRAGITPEDLRNIQRMAEERITEELHRLAAEESAESGNTNSSNEDDSDASEATNSPQAGSNDMEQQQQHQMQQQQQQQDQQQQQHREQQQPQQPARLILQPLPEQPNTPPMGDGPQSHQIPMPMQYGRVAYGRSLAQPVRIPVPMMQAQADISPDAPTDTREMERPHFVQPRSV